MSDKTPRQNDILKKKICEVFKKINLSITISANQNEVDFLDITMNLKNNTFKTFLKPNDKPEYVNKLSNHPPEILKNIPIGINKRLVNISATKEVFENTTKIYSDELAKCGYDHKLTFDLQNNNNKNNERKKKKSRQRKISWFNPPFSKNVSTNVGAKFLKIIDEKIPEPLRKYFNRNTIKVSYRCMPNIKNYIDHGSQLFHTCCACTNAGP